MRPHVHVVPFLKRPGQRLLLPGWLAITIGSHILAWRGLDPAELAHEQEHARQWQRYGPRYIPRYLRASWLAQRNGGHRYWDNEFEVAARAVATRVAESLAANAVQTP
jgi:hypothetical protein